MDIDAFEERAAIIEFDCGVSRFEAETVAAELQGYKRFEVMDAKRKRDIAAGGNKRSQPQRNTAGDVSALQSDAAQQAGQVPECDLPDGRGSMDVPPLRRERGAVL